MLFTSGKFVATGIKTCDAIDKSEAKFKSFIGEFQVGKEPVEWQQNAPPSFMRDEKMLHKISSTLTESAAPVHRTKNNAAKKQSRRLIAKVKKLMNSLRVLEQSDHGDNEDEDVGENDAPEEISDALRGLLDFDM